MRSEGNIASEKNISAGPRGGSRPFLVSNIFTPPLSLLTTPINSAPLHSLPPFTPIPLHRKNGGFRNENVAIQFAGLGAQIVRSEGNIASEKNISAGPRGGSRPSLVSNIFTPPLSLLTTPINSAPLHSLPPFTPIPLHSLPPFTPPPLYSLPHSLRLTLFTTAI